MGLNKQSGNMYGFVTHTWNPIKGRCLHGCTYCYMHRFWKMQKYPALHLDEKELKTNLGENRFIFVGSSTDMWRGTELIWIGKIMMHISNYPNNTYLFQTKNPFQYINWDFKENHILGITLETNRGTKEISQIADMPKVRVIDFSKIYHHRKMITIEPIMDFDLEPFVLMIKTIQPKWVNIGADSGGNKLLEPTKEKVFALIAELEKFTKVHQKPNLKRLINGS